MPFSDPLGGPASSESERTIVEFVEYDYAAARASLERKEELRLEDLLHDRERMMAHRALSAMTLEAIDERHRLHGLMAERQRRYVDLLTTLLGGRDVAEPAVHARRYWCLWQGVMGLHALVPEYPDPGTLVGPMRAVYGADRIAVTGLQPLEPPRDHATKPTVLTERQRTFLSFFEDTGLVGHAPQRLTDVGDLFGVPRDVLVDLFDSFDGFLLAFFCWYDEVLNAELRRAGPATLTSLFALSDWYGDQLARRRVAMELTIAAMAAAIRSDHPANTFHGRRIRSWYLMMWRALWNMWRSDELRDGLELEKESFVFQSLVAGLSQYDLYFPGELSVPGELRAHLSGLLQVG